MERIDKALCIRKPSHIVYTYESDSYERKLFCESFQKVFFKNVIIKNGE